MLQDTMIVFMLTLSLSLSLYIYIFMILILTVCIKWISMIAMNLMTIMIIMTRCWIGDVGEVQGQVRGPSIYCSDAQG